MKLSLTVLLVLASFRCFGQADELKPIYKGVQVSAGIQTTSSTLFSYNDDRPFPTVSAEGGMIYLTRLGASRFYFETGAYLGLVNMGFDYYHDGPLERVISRHVRLKVPVNFDLMIPVGRGFELIPSLGLGFTASIVSNISNDEVEDTGLGFGGIFPHAGVSLLKDHFMLGLSHDFFASIQSEVVLHGIMQISLAYLF